jgi:hypothetical protein
MHQFVPTSGAIVTGFYKMLGRGQFTEREARASAYWPTLLPFTFGESGPLRSTLTRPVLGAALVRLGGI